MATCKSCGCLGFPIRLNDGGLCGECEDLVNAEVEQHSQALQTETTAAENTLNPHTKIARLGAAVSHLSALAQLERRGIAVPDGAERRLEEARSNLDQLILRTAEEELDAAFAEVRATPEPWRKLKTLSIMLLRLAEHRARLGPVARLEALERRVRALSNRIRTSASSRPEGPSHRDPSGITLDRGASATGP